jgi:hypothetical protein
VLRASAGRVAGFPWRAPSLLLCLAAAACASLPGKPAERALYVDARKALYAESRLGWTVDRVEIAESAGQVEPSACRVSEQTRKNLRSWVEARIAEQGGGAEAQFRAGKGIDDLEQVIDLERTRALLELVEAHVPDDCPFWVKPERHFTGLHQTTRRFVLIAESVGGGSFLISGGQLRAAGGGAARLLPAWGFSAQLQLAAGLEVGGDAVLEKTKDGSLAPVGAFRFGAPISLRLTDIDRIYDLELAAVTRLTERELTPWGGRLALAGGISGLRRLGFMPALQVWLAYEYYPEQDGQLAQHLLRLGTRVGIDWDP